MPERGGPGGLGRLFQLRRDLAGEAAVPSKDSTVFAALIGWLVPGEKMGPGRAGPRAVIALAR